jgi:hypothetical protein
MSNCSQYFERSFIYHNLVFQIELNIGRKRGFEWFIEISRFERYGSENMSRKFLKKRTSQIRRNGVDLLHISKCFDFIKLNSLFVISA